MKKIFQFALMAALTILSVDLLVACQPKDAKSPVVGAQNASPQGTSDSGGGTGIDGKVFESYIVDPTKLEAFEKIVAPTLLNLLNEKGERDGSFLKIFKWRTWYIAPVELDKIDKGSLGVSFMKNETQQIARQSMKNVWIDKRIYDKMSLQDQGDLLLHEFVMSVYFIRFMSIGDLCAMAIMAKEGSDCSTIPENLPKFFKPEPTRALNEADNDSIRFVTGWLKQNARTQITQEDFYTVLFHKNFDKRFFDPKRNGAESGPAEQIKLNVSQIVNLLKAGDLTRTMPDQCVLLDGEKPFDCRLKWTASEIKLGGSALPSITLTAEAAGAEAFSFDMFLPTEMDLGTYNQADGETSFNFSISHFRSKQHVGDQVMTGLITLRKPKRGDASQLYVSSIYLRRGIITSIDKTAKEICQVRKINSSNAWDKGVIMYNRARPNIDNERLIMESMPMYAVCSSFNVD